MGQVNGSTMNFTKRKGSTKGGLPPEDLMQAKQNFLSDILESMSMNDNSEDFNFNWHQTGINLVPGALLTMDNKGKKCIETNELQDKR